MWLEKLGAFRNEVLWWEICSSLHDLGKLSEEFLKYRREWQGLVDGYWNDPHEKDWLKAPALLMGELCSSTLGTLSIAEAVNKHHYEEGFSELVRLLKLGDGADSRHDRNNPLFGCEQYSAPIYRGNVFGYETPLGVNLDAERAALYGKMQVILYHYADGGELTPGDYDELRGIIRTHFDRGLSDTTRPANDTSLWEHTYSVASITKALHLQKLRDGNADKAVFHIWGFGFDSLRYLSFSHRIGDLMGRRAILNGIFDEVKIWVEYGIPLGNLIYRDDNMVLFLTPAFQDWATLRKELENEVVKKSLEISKGDAVPRFAETGPTGELTDVVRCIAQIWERTAVPVAEGAQEVEKWFAENWKTNEKHPKSVCPVCRMRPALHEVENDLACGICRKRRADHTEGFTEKGLATDTPMIQEIAQDGHMALILAKFGLHDWLDGSMVKTCLITEPDAIKKTVDAIEVLEDFKGRPTEQRSDWFAGRDANNHAQILKEVKECLNGDSDAAFLYSRCFESDKPLRLRRALDKPAGKSPDEQVTELCAKTPTPSTVLDVWETTKRFFKEAEAEIRGAFTAHERWCIEVQEACDEFGNNELVDAEIGGKRFEAVCEKDKRRFWILGWPRVKYEEEWATKRLTLTHDSGGTSERTVVRGAPKAGSYFRCRIISPSPDQLLALVPAEAAVEITKNLYAEYLKQFGKVYGRLPFSVANIFFPAHLPMFAVLDAARRVERDLRGAHEGPMAECGPPPVLKDLELKLGDGKDDWHHPYILTARLLTDCPSYFKTTAGDMVRMEDLPVGEKVHMRRNLYQYELLGAGSDRFRFSLENAVLLDDLQPRIVSLWNTLRDSGISDSTLRNIEQTLVAREASWKHADKAKARKAFLGLGETLVVHHFKGEEDRAKIREALENRFFLRTLQLYLRILKERMDDTRGAAHANS